MNISSNEQFQRLVDEAQNAKSIVDEKWISYMQTLPNGMAGPWNDEAANALEIARNNWLVAEKRIEDFIKNC
jgi:hypothetical protein